MTEDADVDDGQRYLARRTAVFDVVHYLTEQADALTDNQKVLDENRNELIIGALMLSDGVKNFFDCSEAVMLDFEALAPALAHLTDCLYAVLGGAIATTRHVDISETKRREILRASTMAGSDARTASKEREAERVRHIIERAKKRSDGKLVNPGAVRTHILRELGREKLDLKTLSSWVEYVERTRKTVGPPDEK